MDKMFKSIVEYYEFIDRLSGIAKTIVYDFTYQFQKRISDNFSLESFEILRDDLCEEKVEIKLLQQIFNRRISISMRSATRNDNYYVVKLITIKSVLTKDDFTFFKNNGIFYTLEKANEQEMIEENTDLILDNENYGHIQMIFLDDFGNDIIFIDCHNGVYDLNDKYIELSSMLNND